MNNNKIFSSILGVSFFSPAALSMLNNTIFKIAKECGININNNRILSNDNENLDLVIKFIQTVGKNEYIQEVLCGDNFKKLAIEKLYEAFGYDDFEDYPIANSRVRYNYNSDNTKIKRLKTNWHQDVATWFNSKDKLWDALSFIVWVPIFGLNNKNGIIFEPIANFNVYNHSLAYGCDSQRKRLDQEDKARKLNRTTQNTKYVIFSSYHLHKTFSGDNQLRISLDRRFFSKKMNLYLKNKIRNNTINNWIHLKRNIKGSVKILNIINK